jgi:hypothetical protein
MKKLIEFTDNFEIFDTQNPLHEHVFSLLIIHDNTKEQISSKFIFKFLNKQNEIIDFWNVNCWHITNISTANYFGRTQVNIFMSDPTGVNVPKLETGGKSLSIDEEWNIDCVIKLLIIALLRMKFYSFFKNYRSKLDFINYCKENEPESKLPYF